MSYLEELTGLKKSEEMVLRGVVKVNVRGLTMDETRLAQEAFTRPPVPLMKDPTKGSASAPIPNTDDPGYVKAARAHDDDVKAACVAIATGLVDAGAGVEPIKAAAAKVRATMHDAEVNALLVKMHALSSVAAGVEAALGN